MIVIKCSFDGDLRRFTVPEETTYEQLKKILQKLYDTTETLRINYKDEEGDDLTITTDEELQESIRLANTVKPAILRLGITKTKSNHVVFINGKPIVIDLSQKPNEKDNLKTPAPVSVVMVTQDTTKVNCEAPSVESPVSETPTPSTTSVVVVVPTPDVVTSLAASISRLCLEASNSLMLSTNSISSAVANETSQLSKSTMSDTLFYSNMARSADSPIAKEVKDLCNEAAKQCHYSSQSVLESTGNITKETSNSMNSLTKETISSQNEVLGKLFKDLDDAVSMTMKSTGL